MADNEVEIFQRLAIAERDIASHTAVCDERYKNIAETLITLKDELKEVNKLVRQVGVGVVVALLTFALSHMVFK
jgi:hypothetical protein